MLWLCTSAEVEQKQECLTDADDGHKFDQKQSSKNRSWRGSPSQALLVYSCVL